MSPAGSNLLSFCFILTVHAFHPTLIKRIWKLNEESRPQYPKLQAYSLTSAMETAATKEQLDRGLLNWINPSQCFESEDSVDADDIPQTMPLYPLPATYLPFTGVHHTICNVETRNIHMALDLDQITNPRFCVVLSALDTGRLASTGTVLRILDMIPQYDAETESLARIVLTCVAEERVDILRIENPAAASRESRMRNYSEYLRAAVRPRKDDTVRNESIDQRLQENVITLLVDEYGAVRKLYSKGVGANDLPPFAAESTSDFLSPLSADNCTEASFWKVAQTWQTLCYTVREGRQLRMAADRNEMLVAAAMRKGGPLKLPVDIEDLAAADRRKIEQLEVNAQREWSDLQLDPCIDFQILLSMASHSQRVEYLAQMIRRERHRLEQLPLQRVEDDEDEIPPPQAKGAWLDDDW